MNNFLYLKTDNLVFPPSGPTILPDGYHFVLINRHDASNGETFEKNEWDKNIDNTDAELYSHLSVSKYIAKLSSSWKFHLKLS